MKRLIWIGASDDDLRNFPDTVKSAAGFALYLTQMGERPERSKIMKGFGSAKVIEIQKKSKSGIATPKQEIDLIKQRLKDAKEIHRQLEEEK